MANEPQKMPMIDPGHDPVERLVQHLRQRPYELVRARRLMHRLRVSAHELQQALERFDQESVFPRSVQES